MSDDELKEYTAVRGINVRRYFEATIEAKTAEEAFEQAKALFGPDSHHVWTPGRQTFRTQEDLIDPTAGAWETLAIFDEERADGIDFRDVPHKDEPASYGQLLAFVKRLARTKIRELDGHEVGELDPDSDDDDMIEAISDLPGDDAYEDVLEFYRLIREARGLVTLKEALPEEEDA